MSPYLLWKQENRYPIVHNLALLSFLSAFFFFFYILFFFPFSEWTKGCGVERCIDGYEPLSLSHSGVDGAPMHLEIIRINMNWVVMWPCGTLCWLNTVNRNAACIESSLSQSATHCFFYFFCIFHLKLLNFTFYYCTYYIKATQLFLDVRA